MMRLWPKVCAVLAGVVLCGGTGVAATAAPGSTAGVQAKVKQADAKIAAARTRQAALQAKVSQLEQQNAARRKQLQQRDVEIAALEQKLQAAGVPAAAVSAGH